MALELDSIKRAHLSLLITTDGFKVLQEIFEDELDKFHLKLLNTPAENEAAILAAHKMEKAAAQFYQGVVNRLNAEIELYRNAPKSSDKPVDVTNGVLDLGDLVSAVEVLPNLLGEGE